MKEKLRAFWHDPVWSKVIGTLIAAAILAIVATAWDKYKPGAANIFRLGFAVPLWFLIALVLGTFIVSVLIFSRRLRQSPKIATADHKLKILSASYGKEGGENISVADYLNKVKREALFIPVDNNLIVGHDDPAPNQQKRLRITYTYGDMGGGTFSVPEYGWLSIPQDPQVQQLKDELKEAQGKIRSPRIIAITPEKIELEPTDQWVHKFKLRLDWINEGPEPIRLGRPRWKSLGMGIQGSSLVSKYRLWTGGQWGSEADEIEVAPGQRWQIWLGLDQQSSETADHLFDEGRIGTLVLPIRVSSGEIEFSYKPRRLSDQSAKALRSDPPQTQAEQLSDEIRGFLKGMGPRPVRKQTSKQHTEAEELEAMREHSAVLIPWLQRVQGGWLGRFEERVGRTRHLLAEQGIVDVDLDMALRSQTRDESNILRIADRLLLLSRAESKPL